MSIKNYFSLIVRSLFVTILLSSFLDAYSFTTRCEKGCFEAGTRIYGIDLENKSLGYFKILDMIPSYKKYNVISLVSNSIMKNVKTQELKIQSTSSRSEMCALIVFETVNGQRLAVTQNHAILLSNGKMVAAKEAKKTDFLVQADGSPVAIQNISFKNSRVHVLNILTSGKENTEHTLIAEGLIVGDMAWQDNLKSELNQVLVTSI